MKKLALGLLVLVVMAIGFGAWHYRPIPATHEALLRADLPQLIPLRHFYANSESRWRYQLSPDGTKMSWLESKWLKPALWVKSLENEEGSTFHTPDEVRWYRWSADSRYLLYQADRDGWENDIIVSIDTSVEGAEPRSYPFGKDVKSFIVQVPKDSGSSIIIAHNGRERRTFDLYRLDLNTGETVALGQSQQQGVYWHLTRAGEIYARTRYRDAANWAFETRNGDNWKTILKGDFEDNFSPLGESDQDNRLYAISNMGRDKQALVRFDLKTGEETVLHEEPDVDLRWVLTNSQTNEPQVVASYPDHQKLTFMDENIENLVKRIDKPEGASLHFHTITNDRSKIMFSVETARAGFKTQMVDRKTEKVSVVSTPSIAQFEDILVPVEPVRFTARDGLSIPAYLSRPKGVKGPVPLVIMIHGGPIHRVFGGWNGFRQVLNNRGYAVLDVNYRGGSGYGRAFRKAAKDAVSRQMDDDITDARAWAVSQGIADPDKVAVLGGSFGGLKTLTAMTRNPELYAAGVDINGISDLVSMRQEIPPYWQGWDHWYDKNLGDVNDPTDRAKIKDRSPLTHAANLSAPLLIIQGANDVRVVRSQSDRMVKALKAAGKPVDYILLEGAGHQFRNWGWKTRMKVYRQIERFLAQHLGGRADGFDYAHLGAVVLP